MRAEDVAQRLVQQVRGAVVARDGLAVLDVDGRAECGVKVGGEFLDKMHAHAVLALGVEDLGLGAGSEVGQGAGVAHLAAHLGVEGCHGEYQLVVLAVLLLDVAVAEDACLGLGVVIACEFLLAFVDHDPVGGLYGSRAACAGLLCGHLGVEALYVDGHTVVLEDELGKVERESVGVIERECLYSRYLVLALGLGGLHGVVEQTDAVLKGAQEGLFLLLDDAHDELAVGRELGVCVAHILDERVDEAVHECLLLLQEGVCVAHGPAEDTTNDVSGLGVRRQLVVGDGECYGAQMVGDDTHGHVDMAVLAVLLARKVRYLGYQRSEYVGVIVRGLALKSHAEALEAHARVDDLGRKRLESAVGLAVVLHEHQVPYLDDLRMVVVDQRCAGDGGTLCLGTDVDVNFRAGTAWTRVAHLPEVVVLVAVDDVVGRQMSGPDGGSLVVAGKPLFRRTLEHRGVELAGIEVKHIHQEFPCHIYGLGLEVVAERPVAQHLEHRVMISVKTHFFKVVVLAAHAEALLRVGHTAV